ncbi:MAG TPA: multifunctional oxoglutarate decarboxylase/oxoglutarate dehydrogenase thiamine pyrophosphate-binding subunit/dihydrolipoyllysine-residue succinyltransferase subunit [Solirubrobacteraceae bacterium]|jgi:2-oxoglutarate dehydrogenase E1 component|nr:multifunctional oxoglutarate decarboxylase/oxoglutarate dehydrogenase thiamine pyrophosphate-binding subunit/dihydrolipoyllysine-residue succinyltransferase subunit [Solirubrobacteraceae bacterium]
MATGTTAQKTVDVVTPAAGESVSEGTILEWRVKVGDPIRTDETIVEISTDKVDLELPAPASGTVSEILVEEGETVTVGQVIARISLDGAVPQSVEAEAPATDGEAGDAGNGGAPTAAASAGNGAPAEASPRQADGGNGTTATASTSTDGDTAASAPAGQTIDVVTPAAGESVSEGTILEWRVKVGEFIKADETIVEISTDKVDLELPAPASGTVSEILVEEGETVTVGQVIARLEASAAPAAKGSGQADGNGAAAQQRATAAPGAPAELAEGTKISPVAARAAAVEGVDLTRLSGSGPAGRITKSDVLSAKQTPANGRSATQAAPEAQPMRGGAAALARYMEESRSIPTATSFRTLTVTVLDARRRELKEAGRKVSFTHLIAYAIARAAEAMPVMSNHFAEIDGKPHRVSDGEVNLGLAVDVEKRDGSRTLMVPVIRAADRLSFAEFVDAYDALVEKARTNTLTADDLVGANITLTNPGGLGTVASVPRLMTGQGTIVATGTIAYPPGLGNVGAMIGAEKVMTMTSTYDHRVIQGAESGRFLARIESCLQGEDGFYEDVFGSLGVELGPPPPVPAPAAAAAAAQVSTAVGPPAAASVELLQAVQAATALLKAFRTHGHLAARLDPLGSEPEGDPALEPEPLGLTPELMAQIPAKILRMWVPGATLVDALPHLRETYCGTIAYEIEHIASHRQRVWLREHIESGAFRQPLTTDEKRTLLKRLVEVDALERFMHKAYLGQHQFSIEGLDMTVPMLDELIQLSAAHGGQEVVVGMAHRGRLNVLAHNLGRHYDTIFAEFEGASTLEAVTTIPQGGTGDVKYHHGTQGLYNLPDGGEIRVNLESNPSHLEYVSPVVEGATRAAQTSRQGPRAHQDTNAAVPIVIHGDASFPAQGVVAETFNLQALDGYKVGGTVHLIMNNQVGFTTDPDDARSTRWASDLAKGFDVPIIHVNADDVAACMSAVRLAFAFRQEFGHDVLIDLIGYRRFGHNESDEPAYTQPEMYAKIKNKKRVTELWADHLVAEGLVSQEEVERQAQEVWDNLTLLHQRLKAKIEAATEHGEHTTGEYELDRSPSPEVETAVPAARLRELGEDLLRVPEGFTVHPKLVKQLERRREALLDSEPPPAGIDWAHAEALAFASLLTEGTPLRLTGQDTERGTFSQRHLVLHDAKNGQSVCPIQNLPHALAPLELHNSPLSELACMGFEYGYSQEAPETLVLWEAQFGDFVNSAQVIVDQFIVSGLAKWGQTSRLTLLLPHGYEGSGPEHSSARLERFLALAAEGNVRVASPTTPAQYFHLLRRQARIAKQRPLVVMTPKSLLRLPQASSSIADLAENTRFHPVLAEPGVEDAQVTRLVLCTGKIYYDLVGHPEREAHRGLAVGRVELLYPFPEGQLLELMGRYPKLREVLWVQEEPRNMGARAHMFPRLMQIMPAGMHFGFIGRPERASPGEGYPAAHIDEQNRIVTTAIDLRQPISQYPRKAPGDR